LLKALINFTSKTANYWSHQYSKNLNQSIQKITEYIQTEEDKELVPTIVVGRGKTISINVIHDHHGNTFYPQFMWMKFHVLLLWHWWTQSDNILNLFIMYCINFYRIFPSITRVLSIQKHSLNRKKRWYALCNRMRIM
jgi:hypothetical protein